MSIPKIGFKGVEVQPQQTQVIPTQVKEKQEINDEEKSNATKYMIGATVLAGVVALGIAGYKGKLGKGIQKFLGNGEKASEQASGSVSRTTEKGAGSATSSAPEVAGQTASSTAPKLEKFTEEELAKIKAKTLNNLTEEEFNKVIDTVVSEDEVVLKNYLKDTFHRKSQMEGAKTTKLEDVLEDIPKLIDYFQDLLGKETYAKLMGKDSVLNKRFGDFKIKDYIEFRNALSEEQVKIVDKRLDFNKISNLSNKEKSFIEYLNESGIGLIEGAENANSGYLFLDELV